MFTTSRRLPAAYEEPERSRELVRAYRFLDYVATRD